MCLYWEHNSVSPGILIIRCWTLWMDGPLFCGLFKPSIEFLNFGFQELSFLFSEGFGLGLVSAFCSAFMDAVFYLLSCVALFSSGSFWSLLFGLGSLACFHLGAFPQVSGASWLDIHSKQKALRSDWRLLACKWTWLLGDCTVGGQAGWRSS